MPTQQTETITDETLEAFIKKTKTPQQTYHLPEGSFNGAILNKLNPHFFPTRAELGLYNQFNKQPSQIIKSIILEAENPVAISKQFMNGAYKKLTDPKSPDYLPHTKAQYHINHPDSDNPTLSLHELYNNEQDYVVIFNPKDLENF